ncbi:MAG TPA: tetratricopeptide repeat protein, partial [Cyclobacteriaceae bacterium]|nr:tetratricopeptide repeat protein [Cyclobacteriaceae bacterium]
MKAISLEQIGAKDKAIEEYETLYLKNSQQLDYLYKTTFLQYEVQRFKEASTNADILLANKKIDSLEITFPKGETEQQQVPMRASLLNLKGLIEQAQGNKEEARKHFDAALVLTPDFFIARQNLDLLIKSEK